jgi:putative YhbY family RNA-binding protein
MPELPNVAQSTGKIAPVDELTPSQRRELKARAHHLRPVVIVGDAGLTPEVLREIEANLRSHELIKIRALGGDRVGRAGIISAICEETGAKPVQHIGKILVIYRPRPAEEQKKPAPRRAKRKAPRRTKQSYQNT